MNEINSLIVVGGFLTQMCLLAFIFWVIKDEEEKGA